MKTISKNFLLSLTILLMVVVLFQTYIVHDCSERLKTVKKDVRIEVYEELNRIAWDSTVSINKQHVTGVTRYYKCDVIKKRIEQELK